jgi:hypothetical protein
MSAVITHALGCAAGLPNGSAERIEGAEVQDRRYRQWLMSA